MQNLYESAFRLRNFRPLSQSFITDLQANLLAHVVSTRNDTSCRLTNKMLSKEDWALIKMFRV